MCARYGAAGEFNLLQRTYHILLPEIVSLPQEIIYPHTLAPVILSKDQSRELQMMNYSLVPSWSKDRKPKFATYNARIEEVLNKPSWREPFKSKHCLVPMKYFIESAHFGDFAGFNIDISAKDQHLLTAAGIWDTWIDKKSGEVVNSFAIITTEPTADILKAGHDRCPVFLAEGAWEEWLESRMKAEESVRFLKETKEVTEFAFAKGEALKNYIPQLNLFED